MFFPFVTEGKASCLVTLRTRVECSKWFCAGAGWPSIAVVRVTWPHAASACKASYRLRRKNGNPTRRATQTQLCPSFSMLPWQLPSWTGPKQVGSIENRDSRCVGVACCNGKLQRFPFFCSIENTDGRCVCVACCDGKLQRFPFFFAIDGLHKTPQSL